MRCLNFGTKFRGIAYFTYVYQVLFQWVYKGRLLRRIWWKLLEFEVIVLVQRFSPSSLKLMSTESSSVVIRWNRAPCNEDDVYITRYQYNIALGASFFSSQMVDKSELMTFNTSRIKFCIRYAGSVPCPHPPPPPPPANTSSQQTNNWMNTWMNNLMTNGFILNC